MGVYAGKLAWHHQPQPSKCSYMHTPHVSIHPFYFLRQVHWSNASELPAHGPHTSAFRCCMPSGPLQLQARYMLNHKSKTTVTIASQRQDVLRQRGLSAPIAMSSIALQWLRVDPLSTHTPSAAIKNYKVTARLIAAACGSLGFYAETSKECSISLAAVGSATRI
jgi:hypothetical protein